MAYFRLTGLLLFIQIIMLHPKSAAQGFLKTQGQQIVNEKKQNIPFKYCHGGCAGHAGTNK